MRKVYYVVIKGRIPGLYESIEEVKEQIDGHPWSKYLSFYTLVEAKKCMVRHFIKFPGYDEFKEEMERRERNSVKKYFVVTKGKKPGIYGSLWEAERQVKDFPDGKYVEFKDFHEANACWKNLRKIRLASAWDSIGASITSSDNPAPVLEKPSPSKKKNRAFVVIRGRMKGVFFSEEEAMRQVKDYPNGKYIPFKTKKDAMDYWKHHGTVPYERQCSPGIEDSLNNGILDSVQEILPTEEEMFSEEEMKGVSMDSDNFPLNKPYYAVLRGRKPGVYMGWEKAKAQVEDFPDAVCWGFDSYQKAEEFMGGKLKKEALKAEAVWANRSRWRTISTHRGLKGYYGATGIPRHEGLSKASNDICKLKLKKNYAKKYYVVVRGRKTGVFDSYSAIKELVVGYPGAYFKIFTEEKGAREYYEKLQQKKDSQTRRRSGIA